MSPVRLDPSAYTIGWICALPETEMMAATAMLDEVHENCFQLPHDSNNYVLGRIAHFNVAIACLPKGEVGYHRATAVASRMLATFSFVSIGLMVGIGGGVPSENHDIRLGDVVVNVPSGQTGGVVHHDLGKIMKDDQFLRTGSLNGSPTVLKTTLSKLITMHKFKEGYNIQQHLRVAAERHSSVARIVDHRTTLTDTLYKPEPENASNFTEWVEVERPSRPPDNLIHVHYGVIASGAQVIKSGLRRDEISKALGGVLCFEMEAAGLMNEFPCVVIRGICDYADSHKHKQWQEYAALVAAAYAKELINTLPLSPHVVTQLTSKATEDAKVPVPQWSVPLSRNQRFVGRRAELLEMQKRLMSPSSHRRVCIFGLGGVGKTQIALELAYWKQQADSKCHVFWVPAFKSVAFEDAYRGIGKSLCLPGILERTANVKQAVRDALASDRYGPWLLIVDNADDSDVLFRPKYGPTGSLSLVDYLPHNPQGLVLVTSRNRKVAVKLAGTNIFQVDMMGIEDAREVLRASLPQTGLMSNDDDTNELLDLLGHLPLAIVQAAAYMSENDVDVKEYIELCNSSEQETIDMLSESFEDRGRYIEAKNAVATTWLISFNQISERSSLAIDYLAFMACLRHENIPLTIFPVTASKKQSLEAIGILTAYSFATRQERHVLTMHRLVHIATRNWLRSAKTLSLWSKRSLERLLEIVPDGGYKDRSAWSTYLPHAIHLLASKELDHHDEMVTQLSDRVGTCLYSNGSYNEAEQLHRQTLIRQSKTLGAINAATLRTVARLAEALAHQGKYEEAKTLHENNLEKQRHVLGPEHPDVLYSMRYLGQCFSGLKRHAEAERLHREAKDLNTKIQGPEHPATLTNLSYLAEALRQQGMYTEAEKMHKKILEIRTRTLGPEVPSTLASMSCLGVVQRDLANFTDAESTQLKVLELRTKILGPEHPHTLITWRWLADALQKQLKYDAAIEMFQNVLSVQSRQLGPKHPDTILTIRQLAEACRDSGNLIEARRRYLEALRSYSDLFGLGHPTVLGCQASIDEIDGLNAPEELQAEELIRTDTGYFST